MQQDGLSRSPSQDRIIINSESARVMVTRSTSVRAVALDYNGTLSDDEDLLERIYLRVLAEAGAHIRGEQYREHLLGLPDAEMVVRGLQLGGVAAPTAAICRRVLAARYELYALAVERQPTISAAAVEFVRLAARRVPLAVVSGARRQEIEEGLQAAGIASDVAVIVAEEDAIRGKPDPEPYLMAFRALRRSLSDLRPEQVLGIEDAAPGIAAIRAAGMRNAGVRADIGADIVVPGLDARSIDLLV